MNRPAQLGQYPITDVIGQGSMGIVYKGFDPLIERPVAIKTIRRDLLDGSDRGASIAARFRVEAQAAGRLNHPGIVSVYHFGEDADCAYIVMEYVEGHSLREYVSRNVAFGESDILSLMTQLLDALEFAHERGVLHRDIKPANLILTDDGRLKVTDFGIARIESTQLTRVNALIGSPGYMAPEQYLGDSLDRRVDVFSAGVLLYQLLTRSLPFTGTDDAVMYKIIYGAPLLPSQTEGSAHWVAYDSIVATALAKAREQRYATARAFRDALQAIAVQPIPPVVDRAMLLAPVARSNAPPAGGPPSSSASQWSSPAGSPSRPSQPLPTGWDEKVLATIERDLARFVGPMARVLVRRAARSVDSPQALRESLAQSIPSAADQRAFLQQAAPRTGTRTLLGGLGTGVGTRSGTNLNSGGTGTSIAGTAAGHGGGGNPGSASRSTPDGTRGATHAQTTGGTHTSGLSVAGLPITTEVLEHATKVMLRHVGPIAKVVVRKAAADALTREQLFQRLSVEFVPEAERERVYDELRRPH